MATVAAYLQALTDGATVPTADPDDPRWRKLPGADAEFDEDLDDWDDDDQEDDEEAEPAMEPPTRRRSARRTSTARDDKIERLIRGKSREELADEVLSLVRRFRELREEYRERISLTEGDVDRLVAQARRELRDRTSEMGWRNHWEGEGHTPDYSRLKHRLERIVELGHSDAVVALGREFIERAMAQVEQSHDEGETAMGVAECLPVVFDAVVKSTRSGPEKILCCSTWPSLPNGRTRYFAGMTKCPRTGTLAADGVGPRVEPVTAWPPRLPSRIANGPLKSIGGSWMPPCQGPTSQPTNRRRGISRSCGPP